MARGKTVTRRRLILAGLTAARAAHGQQQAPFPGQVTIGNMPNGDDEYYKIRWEAWVNALNKFAEKYNAGVYDAKMWQKCCKAMDTLRGCKCK